MDKTVFTVPIVYTEKFTEDELLELIGDCNEVFTRLLRMLIQLPVWPDQLTLRGLKRAKRLADLIHEAYCLNKIDSQPFSAIDQGLEEDCDALLQRLDTALVHGQGMSIPDIMKLQLIRSFFQDFQEDRVFFALALALDQAIETVEENIKEANK